MKIELGKQGHFLSGRSRAVDILEEYEFTSLNETIEIDFSGIVTCAQSFVSELIFQLKQRGIKSGQIRYTSVSDENLKRRIQRELERFGFIKT